MAEKFTKKDAVRRALTELGNNAMPVAIQGWIKDNLGIEMTAGHVSTTKGEILRKAGRGDTVDGLLHPGGVSAQCVVVEPCGHLHGRRRAPHHLQS